MTVGDIVIEDNGATVIGQRLNCQTWDLWLDSPDRRIGVRRALVHDFNDRLTINAYGDYPNGVQIVGQLVVDRLFIRGECGFANGIATPSISVTHPSEPPIVTPGSPPPGEASSGLDLIHQIQDLMGTIQSLQSRVKSLEDQITKLHK
jgi:hypothetical protein